MAFYATQLKNCRRVLLYDYFSEHFTAAECNRMCDNCQRVAANRGGGGDGSVDVRDCVEVARAAVDLLKKMRGPSASEIVISITWC